LLLAHTFCLPAKYAERRLTLAVFAGFRNEIIRLDDMPGVAWFLRFP
jgi:hypothetical protein